MREGRRRFILNFSPKKLDISGENRYPRARIASPERFNAAWPSEGGWDTGLDAWSPFRAISWIEAMCSFAGDV